ncbi:MAG: UDP-N-acetylmuramoyl-L-alanyl-D-glutamate--2,6-diaminopimelate ligase [Candidatus Omnitrophica bacterium]|nr:UDP-N-acetylmuramoyl-L-alanyl-D-glutamate--2,6-diaminopimelate ligase [Candidatus Omnitrophota bacterium]
MKLNELLDGIYTGEIEERFTQTKILSVSCDSRKAMMGGIFVVFKGFSCDGSDFIEEAVKKGVFAVATSDDIEHLQRKYENVYFIKVDDPQEFLQGVVLKLFGNPSEDVKTIGVTGTNGKTTVAYLVEAIINETKKECGVIGTINYRLSDNIIPARQTTPGFIDNQHFLTGLAWQDVPYCVIEVSSHALTQDRVHGIDFKTAIFTNLTSDHLDYHQTTENYFEAKSRLFTGLAPEATAVINTDDSYGRQLLAMTKAKIVTYGIEHQADVMAKDIQLDMLESRFTLTCADGDIEIQSNLIGMYNIYNILAAVSACIAEKLDLDTIKRGVANLGFIPGRLERVDYGQDFSVFIDYAHTQDALENVLKAIRQVSQTKIILVFGCGGDRDRSKRPLMGQVAGRLADLSIVTSDNPRSEDLQSIINEIVPGFDQDNYKVIVNREEAIGEAIKEAKADDMVLIAGKGHETYQVLADGKVDFNEREIIEKFLKC